MVRLAIVAVVCALALPLVTFTLFVTPFAHFPPDAVLWAGKAIDFPIAAFNLLLPEALRTHMTWSLRCSHTYCFPRALWIERMHELVGGAAYLLLSTMIGMAGSALRE